MEAPRSSVWLLGGETPKKPRSMWGVIGRCLPSGSGKIAEEKDCLQRGKKHSLDDGWRRDITDEWSGGISGVGNSKASSGKGSSGNHWMLFGEGREQCDNMGKEIGKE